MGLDVSRCEALVGTLVKGDAAAWKPLVMLVGPAVLGYAAGSRKLGHRRTDEDTQHEVLTAVLERIRKHEFRALRTYVAWREAPDNLERTFEDWLRIVTTNVARDYVSYRVRRSALNTLGVALTTGAAPAEGSGMTNLQVVRQLLEHADRCLPPEQADVVRKVYEGTSIEEIARRAGETKAVIEKRLRAAYARLRRWAGDDDTTLGD